MTPRTRTHTHNTHSRSRSAARLSNAPSSAPRRAAGVAMKVKWMIELDGVEHHAELEHGDYTGRKLITLDGRKLIDTGAVMMDRGASNGARRRRGDSR